ncbi:MAG TPA: RNA 2',3'-cyclic phosphodiesterase [Lacipirellulaceae bacterium]|nr:RNA 2',3'-cyclic phosphodiesterase [Lacipirellulaceae bacterium]
MATRTFIAVTISPEIQQAAGRLAELLRPAAGDVKWVEPENLHWTLQFLGDVDSLEIPAVCNAVSTAVSEVESFDIEARGAGAFPSPGRPRTLWIGAGCGAQAMVALQGAIQRKLNRIGYRAEQRRFVPHITLGRAGRKSPPRPLVRELAGLAEFDAGSMLVDEVTIFASKLTPEGPRYDVLARAPLAL